MARNAHNNLKDEELVRSFQAYLWEPITVNEFEKKLEFLKDRVTTHKQKELLQMMYAKRDAWAKSRLRPKFFGGMCTTQCVKCMNKFVKNYLRKGVKMFECIPAIDRAIARMRTTSGKDDFDQNSQRKCLQQH
ncbi:hypothetical protein GBA52_008488 [Prunus armeniaca]|nr:hypothetical protein GBA52_008488 [Prunus armeniaca]